MDWKNMRPSTNVEDRRASSPGEVDNLLFNDNRERGFQKRQNDDYAFRKGSPEEALSATHFKRQYDTGSMNDLIKSAAEPSPAIGNAVRRLEKMQSQGPNPKARARKR